MKRTGLANRTRLVWAIVVKDFVDGFKNRKLMTNTITIIFLVLFYRYLPILGSGSDPTRLVLYDDGESSIVRELDRSEAVRLREVETYEAMVYEVGIEDIHTVGVVLPEDFDQQAKEGDGLVLEAVIDHWVNDADEAYMRADIEPELTRLAGVPVQVNMVREEITQADGAYGFQIAIGLLLVMGMMGMMFTPQLLIQEKESRTLDAMQVSPVTMMDLLIGKGIVGGAYALLMSGFVLLASGQFVLHWWAILIAILAGAFFNVSIGLLLGVFLTDQKQVNLWGFIIFQPFIITMVVGMFEPIPNTIRSAMRWFPTVAMGNAAGQSITASVDLGSYFLSILVMFIWGAAFFGVTAFLLRRAEK
ncbi:MAG: ABC transporter permease [Anaerolineales bacterium]